MPRVPFYSGPIGSAVLPQSFAPRDTGIFAQGGESVGASTGRLFSSIFNPNGNPERQRARLYKAQADSEEYKLGQTKAGDTARSKLGAVFGEMDYREGRAPGATPLPDMPRVVEEVPFEADARAYPTAAETGANRASAIASAATAGLAGGADKDQVLAMMRAQALASGDDNFVTRVNAAMAGTYLGDNQSPSLRAQIEKREDEQVEARVKLGEESRLKIYGLDVESADRRRGQDIDSADSRYATGVQAGTARRGQDISNAREIRADNLEHGRWQYEFNNPTQTTTQTTLGADGRSKTEVKTDHRPARTPGAAPRPAAARPPANKPDPLGIR
jgi:hypothetical protein